MTDDAVRDLLLALEGVEEGAHMGHPDFRLGGRVFAGLTADGRRATLKLPLEAQAVLLHEAPHMFAPAAGAWGRQGWTSVELAAADPARVRAACLLAWEAAVAAPARRSRTTPRRRG